MSESEKPVAVVFASNAFCCSDDSNRDVFYLKCGLEDFAKRAFTRGVSYAACVGKYNVRGVVSYCIVPTDPTEAGESALGTNLVSMPLVVRLSDPQEVDTVCMAWRECAPEPAHFIAKMMRLAPGGYWYITGSDGDKERLAAELDLPRYPAVACPQP